MSEGPAFTETPASHHGHVYPRPDGFRKECGGPRHCKSCRDELVALYEAGVFGRKTLEHQYIDPGNATATLLEAMKNQLLIVMVNRAGGEAVVPVAEVDGTGMFMMEMLVDQAARTFTFKTSKKL